MTLARQRLGAHGEDLAAAWYEQAGYEILDRNWRCPSGEIDLVCRKGGVVVVCEVKTRRSQAFGSPGEAVTVRKRLRLRRLAALWLEAHPGRTWVRIVRFDVASILGAEVRVVEDAW
jgi:putative endonuclease